MTNTPERGFEVPFCQLLQSEGHRIVHIDSHSQQEEGKDVLAIDSKRRLCGYALKHGNIDVARWRREVQNELHELVELAVQHPSFNGNMCKPYLVVTGTLNQPALSRLRAFNATLRARKFEEVELIDRHQLLDRFRRCQDVVLPNDPSDFQTFLELFLSDGRSNLDREHFANFLDSLLPGEPRRIRSGEAKRQLAASFVLAAYAMSAHVRQHNHLAEAEGWTLAAVRVARAASILNISERHWSSFITLACDAASQALHRLADEALENTWLIQGDFRGDGGPVWRARLTMVAGAMAASRLIRRLEEVDAGGEERYLDFIRKHLQQYYLWGESSASYFFLMYWYLCSKPIADTDGENMLSFGYVRSLARANTHRSVVGVPTPYYTVEQCLRHALGLKPDLFEWESFHRGAYTALPASLLLVRAMRRQALNAIWFDVVDLTHYAMDIPDSNDFLRYRSESGTWRSLHLPHPTSWTWLKAKADESLERARQTMPRVFTIDKRMPVLFALCHPHRLTADFTVWLDEQLNGAG